MQDQKPTKGLRGFFQRLREYGARFNSYELKYEGEHPWRYLSFLGGVIITVSGAAYFLSEWNAGNRKEPVFNNPFYNTLPRKTSGISFELSKMLDQGPSQFQVHGEASLTDVTEGSLRNQIWGIKEDTLEALFTDTLRVAVAPGDTVRYFTNGHFTMITQPGEGRRGVVLLKNPLATTALTQDAVGVYDILNRVAESIGQGRKISDFTRFSVMADVNGKAVDEGIRPASHPEELQFSSSNYLKIPAGVDTFHYALDSRVSAVLR